MTDNGSTAIATVTPESFNAYAEDIERELRTVMVGQADLLRDTLISLLAGGHVLLEGVPGLGKTMLVRTLGQALTLAFSRIQFTPDLMPADIVGTNIIREDAGRREFEYQPGPIFASLVLADEVNRATPKTQSALLEAMQERTVTVGNETRSLPVPFFVLATQNPIELEGTYPLPEAQLDRFFFKVLVPFPSAEDLMEIAKRTTGDITATPSPVADAQRLLGMIALARKVPVADHVLDYGGPADHRHAPRPLPLCQRQALRAIRRQPPWTAGAGVGGQGAGAARRTLQCRLRRPAGRRNAGTAPPRARQL